MDLLNSNTPIESFILGNKTVFVKREDLFGIFPAPSLGKLRGLKLILEKIKKSDIQLVGCWDTRVSKLGQGVAVLCHEMGILNPIISYPMKKGESIPESIYIAKSYGAEIYPIRGNHVSICYSQVKKYVENRKGIMLPFGLECIESIEAISVEAKKIPQECIEGGTLIISCGSGVTLAGILNGLKYKPSQVIGISSGRSISKIKNCINKYVIDFPDFVDILQPIYPYYEKIELESPFPSDPNYDLKAWKYLIDNLAVLKEPILFWNIGA